MTDERSPHERHMLYVLGCGHFVEVVSFIGDIDTWALLTRRRVEDEILVCPRCRYEDRRSIERSVTTYENILPIPQAFWDRRDLCGECAHPAERHRIWHDEPPEGTDLGTPAKFERAAWVGLYCPTPEEKESA